MGFFDYRICKYALYIMVIPSILPNNTGKDLIMIWEGPLYFLWNLKK